MTIREYLEQIGATPAEMSAKVVARMEQRMMTDGDLKDLQLDTVMDMFKQIAENVHRQNVNSEAKIQAAHSAACRLEDAIKKAEVIQTSVEKQNKLIAQGHILDGRTCDAVSAFRAVISATQDVFGEENMTEAVIVAAIEAGSYMGWRSIMGPKEEPPLVSLKKKPL